MSAPVHRASATDGMFNLRDVQPCRPINVNVNNLLAISEFTSHIWGLSRECLCEARVTLGVAGGP